MNELNQLMKKIDELRVYMYDLIEKKETLVDKEVVKASQMLDSALDEYHKVLKEKNR